MTRKVIGSVGNRRSDIAKIPWREKGEKVMAPQNWSVIWRRYQTSGGRRRSPTPSARPRPRPCIGHRENCEWKERAFAEWKGNFYSEKQKAEIRNFVPTAVITVVLTVLNMPLFATAKMRSNQERSINFMHPFFMCISSVQKYAASRRMKGIFC